MLVASDGGIFNCGMAEIYGSTGAAQFPRVDGRHPARPARGRDRRPGARWLRPDGFARTHSAFPDNSSGPPFPDSTGSIVLNQPVVGMSA